MGKPADNQPEQTPGSVDLVILVVGRKKDAGAVPTVSEVLSKLSAGDSEFSIVEKEDISRKTHDGEEMSGAKRIVSTVNYARRMQFKTTDVVEIVCRDWRGPYWLQVAGLSPISPRVRGFILLKILAEWASSNPGEYISCKEMVGRIENTTSGIKNRKGKPLWNYPTEGDIYREIFELRQQIQAEGGNPNLIEGSRGHGYRLSTPFWNVRLSVPDTKVTEEEEG